MSRDALKTLFHPFESGALASPGKAQRFLFLGAEPGFLLPVGFSASLELVRGRMGVSSEDAVIQASRALGFQSTSAPLRELIKLARDRLIEGGVVDPDERGLLRERRPAA